MSHSVRNFLRIGCWNINGLTSKSTETEFIKSIVGYDILCLQETKCQPNQVLSFENYYCQSIYRPVENNYPVSGGMMLLINPSIREGITIIKNTSSEIQWIKLSKHFFAFEQDVYLCFTYIAPGNSSYVVRHNLDILSIIENDISRFHNLGDIMIFGDMNARTGTLNDLLDNDSLHLPTPHSRGNMGNICQRKSFDNVCNTRGKELLEL